MIKKQNHFNLRFYTLKPGMILDLSFRDQSIPNGLYRVYKVTKARESAGKLRSLIVESLTTPGMYKTIFWEEDNIQFKVRNKHVKKKEKEEEEIIKSNNLILDSDKQETFIFPLFSNKPSPKYLN